MPVVDTFKRFGLVQPTYIDSGAGAIEATGDGTFNVVFPATVDPGNFLVVDVFAQGAASVSITGPGGSWQAGPTDTQAAVFARASMFYLQSAVGNEDGTNLSIVCAADVFAQARIHRFSHGSGIEASGTAVTGASGTGMVPVDLTTLGDKRLACQLFHALGATTTLGDVTGETNADYAAPVTLYAGTGGGIQQLQTATIASAAAITGGSATLGAARTTRIRLGFAIKP